MRLLRVLPLLVFLALTVLPLLLGLGYAMGYSLGWAGLLSQGFTTEHWARTLTTAEVWQSIGLSVGVALVTIGLSTALAVLAVLHWQPWLVRGRFSRLIYLPLVFPATVMAFLGAQWWSGAGLLSRLSYHLGFSESAQEFPALVNDPWGVGIILTHVFMATPFLAIMLSNIFSHERLDHFAQLARTLGASPAQIRRRVWLPVLLRRARPTLLLYTVFVMSSYEIPLLLGAQSPQMVSVLIIRKLQRFNLGEVPQAYTISVLYTVVVLLLLLLAQPTSRLARSLQSTDHAG